MRDVNISKKELNDLVEELMKSLDSVDFDEYELDIPKATTNRQRKSRGDVTKTPNSKIGNVMNVASTSKQAESNEYQPILPAPIEVSKSVTQPLCTSSPIIPVAVNTQSTTINNSSQYPSTTFSYPQHQIAQNASQMTSSPLNIIVPVGQLNPYQGAIMQNGIIQLPQYLQIIMNIPTIDILQKQQQLLINNSNCAPGRSNETIPNIPNTIESINNSATEPEVIEIDSQPTESPSASLTDDCQIVTEKSTVSKTKSTSNCYMITKYQQRLYKHLSYDLPSTQSPSVDKIIHVTVNGFTDNQIKLFDQQMRIHLQFATQTFMQTFKHPLLGNYAQEFKRFLVSFVCVFLRNS